MCFACVSSCPAPGYTSVGRAQASAPVAGRCRIVGSGSDDPAYDLHDQRSGRSRILRRSRLRLTRTARRWPDAPPPSTHRAGRRAARPRMAGPPARPRPPASAPAAVRAPPRRSARPSASSAPASCVPSAATSPPPPANGSGRRHPTTPARTGDRRIVTPPGASSCPGAATSDAERICESPGRGRGGSLPGFDVRHLGMTQNGSGAPRAALMTSCPPWVPASTWFAACWPDEQPVQPS